LKRRFIAGYWRRTSHTYEPSFRRFIDERMRASSS
jgi:hypothetical protein